MSAPHYYRWYREGSPLVRLLADELGGSHMDADSDTDGFLFCSDSNRGINVVELAAKIENLCSTMEIAEDLHELSLLHKAKGAGDE
jgi:hypothetical protein